jgi:hypothetical protein
MTDQEQPVESTEVHDPDLDYREDEVPGDHDDTDVEAALAEDKDTEDGRGGAVVPKADFESYADASADEKESD